MFLRDLARIVRFDAAPPAYLATYACANRVLNLEVSSPREAAKLDQFMRAALLELAGNPAARTDAINAMLRDAAQAASLG